MRSAFFAALVVSAFAQQLEGIDRDSGKTREEIGHVVVKSGVAPQLQELTPRFRDYDPTVKRTKVRYGPYKLPSINATASIFSPNSEPGTMTSMGLNMKKPCNDCGLIVAQAGLEYADGSVADNSNGGNKYATLKRQQY
jgi:hypothetical protein